MLRIGFYCAHKDTETESEEKIVRLSFGSISWIFLVSAESESETIKLVTLFLALGPGPTMKVFEFVTA